MATAPGAHTMSIQRPVGSPARETYGRIIKKNSKIYIFPWSAAPGGDVRRGGNFASIVRQLIFSTLPNFFSCANLRLIRRLRIRGPPKLLCAVFEIRYGFWATVARARPKNRKKSKNMKKRNSHMALLMHPTRGHTYPGTPYFEYFYVKFRKQART